MAPSDSIDGARPTGSPRRVFALALSLLCGPSLAQTESPSLPPVSITGRATIPPASIAGFGELPTQELPMQLTTLGESQLRDNGSQGLRELARVDASVGDAYNAVGYWDSLTVRGFVIDQRYNYRRDGLPITGETALALDNKSRLELLKGTSGIQAGTSAPGGLVNLVVKRPDVDLRSVTLELRGARTALAAADLSTRFGDQRAFGLRLNAVVERLDPELDAARGSRRLLALAGDWRIGRDTLIEAEVEHSNRSQPSQPGFSLLGDRVPAARDVDPRINLNDQPWSQPVVFDGRYASLRITQRVAGDWRAVLHAGTQRLDTDDRLAFPYGCSAEGRFDRFCSDGSFDFYDYRSESERRRSDAVDLGLNGSVQTGPLRHALGIGLLHSRFEARLQGQAYNFVGTGTIDGRTIVAPDPTLAFDNTNRDESSKELYLRDAVQLGPTLGLWLGLRHTRLERSSVTTSGTEPTQYARSFTTPWVAVRWEGAPGHAFHASWGQGVESDVVPGLPALYVDAGQALPARKSRQTELGYRHAVEWLDLGAAVFQIAEPVTADRPVDTPQGPLTTVAPDGLEVHRGIELDSQARLGRWTLGGSAQWLRARREGSSDPTLDGTRPANVPGRSVRMQATYAAESVPGLKAFAALLAESDRTVMPGADSPRIGGWARLDAGTSYAQVLASGQRLLWRAGVDNLLDRRAWKESPYQFSHVYLYPMAPRTWRVSVQADL